MSTRRTVFQPDKDVDLPEDEEAQLERDGLLLPVDKPAPKAGATVAAKEASPDGNK